MSQPAQPVSSSFCEGGFQPSCQPVARIVGIALASIALVTGLLTFLHLQYGFSFGGIGAFAPLGIPGSLGLAGVGAYIFIVLVLCSVSRHYQKDPLRLVDTLKENDPHPLLDTLKEKRIFQTESTLVLSPEKVEEEFKTLADETKSLRALHRTAAGRHHVLRVFNRYPDVFSADQWLYPLHGTATPVADAIVQWNGVGNPPYINASCMGRLNGDIITQGPLDTTLNDFWKMAWGSQAAAIVMVTPFKEGTKVKCNEYFPRVPNQKKTYGDIHITLTEEKAFQGFTERTFLLQKDQETKTITHIHCDGWIDNQHYPPKDLLALIECVYKKAGGKPIITLCSAGIGRSGTFYACYLIYCLKMQSQGDVKVNVFELVKYLREFRPNLVQTPGQYGNIYDFIHLLNTQPS